MSTLSVRTGTRSRLGDFGRDQAEDDVDVVDHQVEHDVDVGGARLERREPVTFHEARAHDAVAHGHERGVEALEVPDAQLEPAGFRGRDQRVGLLERRSERLFHQHVDAGVEQR
jgi:hypothetical protein